MLPTTLTTIHDVTIDIGGTPILLRTDSAFFAHMLEDRYGEFVIADASQAVMELEIKLVEEAGRDTGHETRDTGDRVRDSGDGRRETGDGTRDSGDGLRTSDPQPPAPGDLDSSILDDDIDLTVRRAGGLWVIERGDYSAEWDPATRRGWVRQTANPYSIDCVLRILHSLILAQAGGFLVHAASAVRNGRAFVFAGISGTGKTTLSRLAPPDVMLLTDEISYVRPEEQVSGAKCQVSGGEEQVIGGREQATVGGSTDSGLQIQDSKFQIADLKSQIADSELQITNPDLNRQSTIDNRQSTIDNQKSPIANHQSLTPNPESRVPSPESLTPDTWHLTPSFSAHGTPFAGELARIGCKMRAPLAGLFLLKQGPENRIEPVSEAQAIRELMRHVLFFSHDEELVGMIFQTVCDFVKRVPVRRLVFTKDARVWELIS